MKEIPFEEALIRVAQGEEVLARLRGFDANPARIEDGRFGVRTKCSDFDDSIFAADGWAGVRTDYSFYEQPHVWEGEAEVVTESLLKGTTYLRVFTHDAAFNCRCKVRIEEVL